MNNLNFFRVATATPEVKPGDVQFNVDSIIKQAEWAAEQGTDLLVLPELCITGYTCADLFYQSNLLTAAYDALSTIALQSAKWHSTAIVVGLPFQFQNSLYNCAAVILDGNVYGIVPKQHLPNYNEFYEKRWFTPAPVIPTRLGASEDGVPFGTDLLFSYKGVTFGIEICEDLWVPIPPSCHMAQAGAEIILNLSATNEQAGKHDYLLSLIQAQSARCRCAYVYASAGVGESSTDLAFAGNRIIAENGRILRHADRFQLQSRPEVADIDTELLRNDRLKFSSFSDAVTPGQSTYTTIKIPDYYNEVWGNSIKRYISAHPFTDGTPEAFKSRCEEILSMQAWGLAQRMRAINCRRTVIGISGGLDSTLALLVAAKAYDMLGYERKDIIAITMPGFGTTGRTYANALRLMELLGTTTHEISIAESVRQHFSDIKHDESVHDAVYENGQARERTQILMDMANKVGGIVIGTGDLSELALGWCTYNGDQMSMYGVNASIPKTLVRHLVQIYADNCGIAELKSVLEDIIDTPISPELLPADNDDKILQKTEDLVGPYELHDFFLYNMMRNAFSPTKIFSLAQHAFAGVYDDATIKHWLRTFYRRFFNQQFKRSAMPDGVKVGSVSLSPRGDWRMPSDASAALWLEEIENIDVK